jgi:hypothetical protein
MKRHVESRLKWRLSPVVFAEGRFFRKAFLCKQWSHTEYVRHRKYHDWVWILQVRWLNQNSMSNLKSHWVPQTNYRLKFIVIRHIWNYTRIYKWSKFVYLVYKIAVVDMRVFDCSSRTEKLNFPRLRVLMPWNREDVGMSILKKFAWLECRWGWWSLQLGN